jgi:putative transposase
VKNRYQHFKATDKLKEELRTIRTNAHATFNCNYHFVWIPKYRRPILKHPKVKEILEKILRGQAECRDWKPLALEIMPDHIHYFVSVPPSYAPSEVMHILKGNTSRQLRLVFPFLKTIIRDSLWADGYYVSTAGFVSQEQVRRYIDEQSKRLNLRFDKELDETTKRELDGSILDYLSSIPPSDKSEGILEATL